MGTIITHGKSKWGRSNKHKRKDPVAESLAEDSGARTKPLQNADIVSELTETTMFGDTAFIKFDSEQPTDQPRPQPRTNTVPTEKPKPAIIEHNSYRNVQNNKVDLKEKDTIVTTEIDTEKKKTVENKYKKTDMSTDNDHDMPFIEDIDGWEEKLKLLNDDLDDSPDK